ncbi:hypothetical protein [Terriglobus sp.]|uniref:hypothetical protein n=1 Tax=Terriglobus sp. TaxID=1889013 RepID=UPI003B0053E5
MEALHITEMELARDIHDVLARLRAGEEVVIEGGEQPLVLRALEQPRFRTIDDAIAGFKAYEAEHGHPLMMDEDYAADMREIIASRKPSRASEWD